MRPVAAALWSMFALSFAACNDAGTDLGLTPRQREVLVAEVRLPEAGQPVAAKLSQLLKRAASLPDVEQVAVAEALSDDTTPRQAQIEHEGDPPNIRPPAYVEVVSPGYFRVMEMRLIRGRLFSESDGQASSPVIIVNETYKQQMSSQGEDLLGRRLRLEGVWLTIVGVVQDGPGWHRPKMYIPHTQFDGPLARSWSEYTGAGAPTWFLLARVAGDQDDVAVRLQGALGLEFLTLDERLKAHRRAMESGSSGG